MHALSASAVPPADRPVFVVGEREPALDLVRALGDTSTLCAMPASRLLQDLVQAVERCPVDLDSLGAAGDALRRPANWYREVQVAHTRASGKIRSVEFSGMALRRLHHLFPHAQFLVVHRLNRAIPPSRRLPALAPEWILEVDSGVAATAEAVERVLTFLGEVTESVVVDLSDHRMRSTPVAHSKR